jgi:hypothetical protein
VATNNITRFRKEDYEGSPSWWDRAIYNLNLLIDYIYAINQAITSITTSLAAQPTFQTYQITQTSASNSTTHPEANTLHFTSTLKNAPKQLLISVSNASYPVFTSAVYASWHYVNGVVYVDAITGLANSTQYNLTITIF